MRPRILAVVLLAIVGVSAPGPLLACGDKFLLPPRGMSFDEAYRARHPGSVLIFAPTGTATADAYSKVQALLARAGHRVAVVHDASQVSSALASAKADVVLTTLSEADIVSSQAGTPPTAPRIFAVLTPPGKANSTTCKTKYSCDLKSTDKPERFVVAVNSAMDDRAKASTKHGL
jgi:hypothetical protein